MKQYVLTKEQNMHLKTIEWLISDSNLRTGRTTVLCIAFMNKALNNLGTKVSVFDHHNSKQSRRLLIKKIESIFNEIEYNEKYNLFIKDSTIMIKTNDNSK